MRLVRSKNKKEIKWMMLSLLTVLLFLIVLEAVHPYYFMCDDNLDSYIAVYSHTMESVLHGEWVKYNFHQFSGIRFLSHGQTGGFNIFTYLSYGLSVFLFGHKYAMIDILAIFHLTFAAFAMYLVLKKMNCSAFAAYLGSVAWALNSFTVYLGRAWIVVIIVAAFLPMMIFLSINYMENPNSKTFLASVLWKTLSFYCLGQPQFFAYAIIVDFLFVIPYAIVICKKGWKSVLCRYFFNSAVVIFLCLPLLVPMYKEVASSVNRASKYSIDELTEGKEMPSCLLVAMFFPFLNVGNVTHSFDLFELHAGHFGYVLLLAILIGLVKLYRERENEKLQYVRKIVGVLFIPIGLTLLYGCSSSFLRLMNFVPVINQFRWPMKIIEYSLMWLQRRLQKPKKDK